MLEESVNSLRRQLLELSNRRRTFPSVLQQLEAAVTARNTISRFTAAAGVC